MAAEEFEWILNLGLNEADLTAGLARVQGIVDEFAASGEASSGAVGFESVVAQLGQIEGFVLRIQQLAETIPGLLTKGISEKFSNLTGGAATSQVAAGVQNPETRAALFPAVNKATDAAYERAQQQGLASQQIIAEESGKQAKTAQANTAVVNEESDKQTKAAKARTKNVQETLGAVETPPAAAAPAVNVVTAQSPEEAQLTSQIVEARKAIRAGYAQEAATLKDTFPQELFPIATSPPGGFQKGPLPQSFITGGGEALVEGRTSIDQIPKSALDDAFKKWGVANGFLDVAGRGKTPADVSQFQLGAAGVGGQATTVFEDEQASVQGVITRLEEVRRLQALARTPNALGFNANTDAEALGFALGNTPSGLAEQYGGPKANEDFARLAAYGGSPAAAARSFLDLQGAGALTPPEPTIREQPPQDAAAAANATEAERNLAIALGKKVALLEKQSSAVIAATDAEQQLAQAASVKAKLLEQAIRSHPVGEQNAAKDEAQRAEDQDLARKRAARGEVRSEASGANISSGPTNQIVPQSAARDKIEAADEAIATQQELNQAQNGYAAKIAELRTLLQETSAQIEAQLAAGSELNGQIVGYARALAETRANQAQTNAYVNEYLAALDGYALSLAESKESQQTVIADTQKLLAADDQYILATAEAANARREQAAKVKEDQAKGVGIGAALPAGETRNGIQSTAGLSGDALVAAEAGNLKATELLEAQNKVAADLATARTRIITDTLKMETENLAVLNQVKTADERLATAIKQQQAAAEKAAYESGPNKGSFYQQLQASIKQRPGEQIAGAAPGEVAPTSFENPLDQATLAQTIKQRFSQTVGFAVSGVATYAAFSFLQKAFTDSVALEKQLSQIKAEFVALGDEGNYAGFRDGILSISRATGEAASSVAQLAQQFKGAFSTQTDTQILQQVQQAVELSKVTGISLTEITNNLTAIAVSYGTTVGHVGDIALTLQDRTGVAAQETITAVSDMEVAAIQAGATIQQVASIAAVAAKYTGQSGSSVAEGLNRILPAIETKAAQIVQVFQQAAPGVVPQVISDLAQGNTFAVFDLIGKNFHNLSKEQQDFVASLLGSRRDAKTAIDVWGNYNQVLTDNAALMNSNGRLQKGFSDLQATLAQQMAKVVAAFKSIGAELLSLGASTVLQGFAATLALIINAAGAVVGVLSSINTETHGGVADVLAFAAGIFLIYKTLTLIQESGYLGALKGGLSKIGGLNPVSAATGAGTEVAGAITEAGTSASTGLVGAGETVAAAIVTAGDAAAAAILAASAGGAAVGAGGEVVTGEVVGAELAAVKLNAIKTGIATDLAAATPEVVAPVASAATTAAATAVGLAQVATPIAAVLLGGIATKDLLSPTNPSDKALDPARQAYIAALNNSSFNDLTKGSADLAAKAQALNQATNKREGFHFGSLTDPSTYNPFTLLRNVGRSIDTGIGPTAASIQDDAVRRNFAELYSQAITSTLGGPNSPALTSDLAKFNNNLFSPSGIVGPNAPQVAGFSGTGQAAIPTNLTAKDLQNYVNGTTPTKQKYDAVVAFLQQEEKSHPALVANLKAIKDGHDQAAATLKAAQKAIVDLPVLEGQADIGAISPQQFAERIQAGRDANIQILNRAISSGITDATTLDALTKAVQKDQADIEKYLGKYLTGLVANRVQAVTLGGGGQGSVLQATIRTGIAALNVPFAYQTTEAPQIAAQIVTAQQGLIQYEADHASSLAEQATILATPVKEDPTVKRNLDIANEVFNIPSAAPGLNKAIQDAINNGLTNGQNDFYNTILSDPKGIKDALTTFLNSEVTKFAGEILTDVALGKKVAAEEVRLALANVESQLANLPAVVKTIEAQLGSGYTSLPIEGPKIADVIASQTAANVANAGTNPLSIAQAQQQGNLLALQAAQNTPIVTAGKSPADITAQQANKLLAVQKAQTAVTLQSQQIASAITAQGDAYYGLLEAQSAGNPVQVALYQVQQANYDLAHANGDVTKIYAAQAALATANKAVADALNATADANYSLLQAIASTDPLKAAQIALQKAQYDVAHATSDAARIAALTAEVAAKNQVADAITALGDAQFGLLIALDNAAGNTIKAAQDTLKQARYDAAREIAKDVANGTPPGQDPLVAQNQAKIVAAAAAVQNAQFSQDQATINFDLAVKKISTGTAIAELQNLERRAKGIAQQQQIEQQIYTLQQQLQQNLQFNLPTDIALPGLYQSRRASETIGGPGAYNDNRQINVQIITTTKLNPKDITNAVTDAITAPPRFGTRGRTY